MTRTAVGHAAALLQRVDFVLIEPSHPGNIGAAARAMKVMGLHALTVVAPRFADALSHPDALAFAGGATDVLLQACTVPSLDDAIGAATLAIAVSARGREFGPRFEPPETLAQLACSELESDSCHRVAFVFGSERIGLSIEHVSRCQRLLSIPADAQYDSLNLAQAVQIVSYCLRQAALARAAFAGAAALPTARIGSPDAGDALRTPNADQRSVEQLFEHLERALVAIGYLDPRNPKKLMLRLRRLFGRTRLETEELDILRGICATMEQRRR